MTVLGKLWITQAAAHGDPLPAYDSVRASVAQFMGNYPFGDPDATGEAILAIVDAEEPPLRVSLGAPPLQIARDASAQQLATWERWDGLSRAAQGG